MPSTKDRKESRRSVLRKSAVSGFGILAGTSVVASSAEAASCGEFVGPLLYKCEDDWPPDWANVRVSIDLDPYGEPDSAYVFQVSYADGGHQFFDRNLGPSNLEMYAGNAWAPSLLGEYNAGDLRPASDVFYFGENVTDVSYGDTKRWKNIDLDALSVEWL